MSEKALYMLATILKSPVATETTLGIIETFAQVRELSRTIADLHKENGDNKTVSYIPKYRETENHDFKNIFLMRDLLGKIDGYRFYEDYFEEIDRLCDNPDDTTKFEQILICVLHEPKLLLCIILIAILSVGDIKEIWLKISV